VRDRVKVLLSGFVHGRVGLGQRVTGLGIGQDQGQDQAGQGQGHGQGRYQCRQG